MLFTKKLEIMNRYLLTFLLGVQAVFGQDFRVLHSYGNNTIKKTKQKIFIGATLKNTDVLLVGENSYLNLLHVKTGRTVEVRQKGEYLLSSFKVNASSSTLAKYSDFVIEEMTKATKQDINKNHRRYIAITGAVTRDRRAATLRNITVFVPAEVPCINLYNAMATVAWLGEVGKKYYIRIKTMSGETVALLETQKPEFNFDFGWLKRDKDGLANYEVVIYEADNENVRGSFAVSLLEEKDRNMLAKELKDFQPQTAIDYLLLGRFFEENKLLLDAFTCYNKALKLQEDEIMKTAYMEFLARNKMGYMYNPELDR